jgi:hypothetical protein
MLKKANKEYLREHVANRKIRIFNRKKKIAIWEIARVSGLAAK